MSARLQPDGQHAYATVDEFIGDLEVIETSLAANRGEHAGGQALQRVLRRARSFGFHMAALDLRQDSAAHDIAIGAVLDEDAWGDKPLEERLAQLHALIGSPRPKVPDADAAAASLAVFRTVKSARARYGEDAFGPYIVSMSRSAADALAVLALARIAGCTEGEGDGEVPLDVAPLFETVDDLDAAAGVMRSLFDDPV